MNSQLLKMNNFIEVLYNDGFFEVSENIERPIYHLKAPCRFNIKSSIVKQLKDNYLTNEEIGGILWVKPTKIKAEIVYVIEDVSFIRNAIEDTEYTDKQGRIRTRADAYLPDAKIFSEKLENILSEKRLPIKFHTHPTKGRSVIEDLTIKHFQTETSDQDRLESLDAHSIGSFNVLMPRALIVGNSDFANNIFIGLYNGFIAPVEFESAKKKVQSENLQRISDQLAEIDFSDSQKIALGIGAALVLFSIVKYPKYSLPAIGCLLIMAPALLNSTKKTQQPHYFNVLSDGEVNIYIPGNEKI